MPRYPKRRSTPSPAPRYLFTLVDGRGGKLYSGLPQGARLALEVTDLDTGKKDVMFTVPRRNGLVNQISDLQARLKEETGRDIINRKLV